MTKTQVIKCGNILSAVAGAVTIPTGLPAVSFTPVNFSGLTVKSITIVSPVSSVVSAVQGADNPFTVRLSCLGGAYTVWAEIPALNLMQECNLPFLAYQQNLQIDVEIFGKGTALDSTLAGSFPVDIHLIYEA